MPNKLEKPKENISLALAPFKKELEALKREIESLERKI